MLNISMNRMPLSKDEILDELKKNEIQINHYAKQYISHPRFSVRQPEEITVTVISLEELGMKDGATLYEVFRHIQGTRFMPCPSDTGFFLRLAWTDQPQSINSILTGTHSAPDQSVTVLSDFLEQDDAFPKGLYLRKVDGRLWLRGYVCERDYCFPGDALFALATRHTDC